MPKYLTRGEGHTLLQPETRSIRRRCSSSSGKQHTRLILSCVACGLVCRVCKYSVVPAAQTGRRAVSTYESRTNIQFYAVCCDERMRNVVERQQRAQASQVVVAAKSTHERNSYTRTREKKRTYICYTIYTLYHNTYAAISYEQTHNTNTAYWAQAILWRRRKNERKNDEECFLMVCCVCVHKMSVRLFGACMLGW